MDDWSKYLDNTEYGGAASSPEDARNNSDTAGGCPPLTLEDVRVFCERLSGKDDAGQSKAILTYQTYDTPAGGGKPADKNADIIYNCTKAHVELSFDALNPELALLTVTFPTYDDPELRLMWARIGKWRRRDSGVEPFSCDQIPIFLIHLFERNGIGVRTDVKETILEADIVNPLICYLTRETPTAAAVDTTNEKGETIGGNVIKMLCNMNFITFSVTEDADTSSIKAEVLRECEADRYLTAAQNSTDTLSAYNLN